MAVRVERKAGFSTGWVLGTDPEPGTMVAPGSTVVVTSAGRMDGEEPPLVGTWLPDDAPVPGLDAWRGRPYVQLRDDGTYRSYDGCQSTDGRWSQTADSELTFTAGASRLVSCDNYRHPLAQTRAFDLDADRLSLLDGSGRVLVSYVRS